MGSGNNIAIEQTEPFPGKIAKIGAAVDAVRASAGSLKDLLDLAKTEAGSFTRDGAPAAVYGPLLDALRAWLEAVGPVVTSGCDSAANCAATAGDKHAKMIATDAEASRQIQNLSPSTPS